MKLFVCCCVFLLCCYVPFANSAEKKAVPPEKTGITAAPANVVDSDTQRSEPFTIPREVEARREEVEAPEIEVTGILQVSGKTIAMARLQLEKVEGKVILEKGMRVSIPKPDKEESESERWTTYFEVKKITGNGMVIELENGETVWYPVMGEVD